MGDGRQLLPPIHKFQVEYCNGLSAAEAYAEECQVEPRQVCFAEDPRLEATVRKSAGKVRQYLGFIFGSKRKSGKAIPLIYFPIQPSESKTLKRLA